MNRLVRSTFTLMLVALAASLALAAPSMAGITTGTGPSNPGITIDKLVSVDDGAAVDSAQAHEGDPLEYVITVSNGDDVERLIDVTDNTCSPLVGDTAGYDGDGDFFALNQTVVYRCDSTAPAADVQNQACVTELPQNRGGLNPCDTANVDVLHPGISLNKSGSLQGCGIVVPPPDFRIAVIAECKEAHEGDTITYTFTVQNTGDTPLENVSVTDIYCTPAYVSGDDNLDDKLDLQETWIYTCDYVILGTEGDPLVNDACANGADAIGGAAPESCDDDSIDVLHPDIEISKCADNVGQPARGEVTCDNVAHEGDQINYTLSVTNPGDTPLGQVAVTDMNCDADPAYQSGDTNSDGLLDPGETWIYTCSKTVPAATDPLNNEACATGYDSLEGSDMDCDTESVDVLHPAIEIKKDVLVDGNCWDRSADRAGRGLNCSFTSGHVGETITYYFQVHNSGDAQLEYTISDPLCDSGTLVKESEDVRSLTGTFIAAGDYDYWTCTHLITQADLDALYADGNEGSEDLVNEACVNAFDQLGGPASSCDTAEVSILDPELEIDKFILDYSECKSRERLQIGCYTDFVEGVEEGDRIEYVIILHNSGNVGVSYTIDDPNCTSYAVQSGRSWYGFTGFISENQTYYIYCYHVVDLDDPDPYVNTACATGEDFTDYVSDEVCDDATADLVFNTVAGRVFEDLDADGVKDEGEPGIPDRQLKLTVEDFPRVDRGEEPTTLTTTTDANGNYLFDRVPDGNATLTETMPEGWTCSYPSPCSYTFPVDEPVPSRVEAVAAKDFGNWTTGAIAGTAFNDVNGNGSKDSGDGALGGFTYYVDLNDNSAQDSGEPSAVSAGDGTFGFAGLNPGGYKVRQINSVFHTCTAPSPCVAAATVVSRGSAAVAFGNHAAAPPAAPAAPPDDLGGALPAGAASRRARLRLPSGCRRASFVARVTGPQIVRVVFSVDGRTVRTLRRGPFSVRIDPRGFRAGAHSVTARVTFEPGTGNRARTLRSTFLRCRAAAAPRFTG